MGSLIYDPTISSIVIKDESLALLYPDESDDGAFAWLVPGFASRGRDNKITELRGPGAFKSNFGDDCDSFPKFGQPNMNVMRALKSGARAFFCNLKPTDAKRANMVVGIAVRDEEEIPQWLRDDTVVGENNVFNGVIGTGNYVKDENENLIPIMVDDGSGNLKQLVHAGKVIKLVKEEIKDRDPYDGTPQFNGLPYTKIENGKTWRIYPLFLCWYYGRGLGGNDHGIKIYRDSGRDGKVDDGRRYTMEIFEFQENGQVNALIPEPYYFSFNPDARFNPDTDIDESLRAVYYNKYPAATLGHSIGEQFPVQLITFPDNYVALTTVLSGVDEAAASADDIDFIFGKDRNFNKYSHIIIDQASLDPSIVALRLEGGTDGSIQVGENVYDALGNPVIVDEAYAEKIRRQLLQQFFTCDIDDDVFDERIVDCDAIPDGNWPMPVKRTLLAQFQRYRPDVALVMDVGITANYREALNYNADLAGYINGETDFMVYFGAHCGFTKDPTVITPRHVTYTYDFVGVLSDIYGYPEGRFQMIAGYKLGRTRFINWDWIAIKNKVGIFEKMELAKLNYIEKINKRGDTMYGTETTKYNKDISKLTSFRNALVIGDAMRQCHKILVKYKYDPQAISQTISDCTKELYGTLRFRYPATIGIQVRIYQTKRDQLTDNAHCDIIFVFPNFIKKFAVTIIARRETLVEDNG